MNLIRENRIWNYFKLDERDKSKAVCLLCITSTKSLIPKSKFPTYIHLSMKPLWTHLELKHESKYKEAKQETDYYLGSNPFLNYDKQEAAQRHLSFESAIEKNKTWCLKQKNAKDITYLIGEMLCLANLPVKTVDTAAFHRFLNRAEPRYPIPTSLFFASNVLPNIFDKIKNKIKDGLVNAPIVSLTTDIWSSISDRDTFLSFTAHWIDRDTFVKRKAVLSCHHFAGKKMDDQIKDKFYELFDIWNLNLSSVHVVMQHSACDFTESAQDYGLPTIDCFVLNLHSCIYDAVFNQKLVVDVINKARRMVNYFKNSKINSKKLFEIQERCKLSPTKELVLDVPTRWQSTFCMIEILQNLKRAIVIYVSEFNEMDGPVFTGNQWRLLGVLIDLLKPLQEITKQASNAEEGISVVIPFILTIIKFLSREDENDRTFKKSLLEAVTRKFLQEKKILSSKFYTVATALDPRFMFSFFPNLEVKTEVKFWIYDDLQCLSVDDSISMTSSKSSVDEKRNINSKASIPESDSQDIWRCLEDLGKTGDSVSNFDIGVPLQKPIVPSEGSKISEPDRGSIQKRKVSTINKTFEKELNSYQKLGRIDRMKNPLAWWQQKATEFPNLSKLVSIVLSCPSSHVENQTTFNQPSTSYEEGRDQTLPRNNDKYLFINKNLPLFNLDY